MYAIRSYYAFSFRDLPEPFRVMRLRPDLPDIPVDHALQGAGVADRGQVDVHDHVV